MCPKLAMLCTQANSHVGYRAAPYHTAPPPNIYLSIDEAIGEAINELLDLTTRLTATAAEAGLDLKLKWHSAFPELRDADS